MLNVRAFAQANLYDLSSVCSVKTSTASALCACAFLGISIPVFGLCEMNVFTTSVLYRDLQCTTIFSFCPGQ